MTRAPTRRWRGFPRSNMALIRRFDHIGHPAPALCRRGVPPHLHGWYFDIGQGELLGYSPLGTALGPLVPLSKGAR